MRGTSRLQGVHTVFNLEVRELHNFLVGRDRIVVHNGYIRADIDDLRAKYKNNPQGIDEIADPFTKEVVQMSDEDYALLREDLYFAVGTITDPVLGSNLFPVFRLDWVKAWKVLIDDSNLRKIVGNLEKVDGHLAKNIHTADELETAFKAASDKAKWVDDIGFNVLRKPGRNAEYVNPNGKLLKWTEEANINAKIDDWLANTSGNKQLEAQVADVIRGQKPVEGLGIGVKRGNNSSAGDLDVYTKDELLEVKAGSGSINYNQLNKYVDDSLDDFLNPYGKKVILYIDQPMSSSVRQTVEGNLPTGVSLANSHSELLGLLQ